MIYTRGRHTAVTDSQGIILLIGREKPKAMSRLSNRAIVLELRMPTQQAKIRTFASRTGWYRGRILPSVRGSGVERFGSTILVNEGDEG